MSEKKEYIERGALIDAVYEGDYSCVSRLIEEFPAADVEPVVRGESRINDQGFLECSACGKTLRMPLISTYEMKRCYICGAHFERSDDV